MCVCAFACVGVGVCMYNYVQMIIVLLGDLFFGRILCLRFCLLKCM